MKPEYKFVIDGEAPAESVLAGLLHSGYVVSKKRTLGENYEISVYGKERVDGGGIKITSPDGGLFAGDIKTQTTTITPNIYITNDNPDIMLFKSVVDGVQKKGSCI